MLEKIINYFDVNIIQIENIKKIRKDIKQILILENQILIFEKIRNDIKDIIDYHNE